MVTIRMTALGFGNNRAMLDVLQKGYPEEQKQLLHQLGIDVIDEARHNISLNGNIDTGGLLGSIKIIEEGETHVIVGTDAPHAGYIEFGRGPIEAQPGKTLRFFDKKTGKLVFVKEVGPVEPQPFLEPAVIKHSKTFKDVYAEKMENIIKTNVPLSTDSEEL